MADYNIKKILIFSQETISKSKQNISIRTPSKNNYNRTSLNCPESPFNQKHDFKVACKRYNVYVNAFPFSSVEYYIT